jgi:hypothetical protein
MTVGNITPGRDYSQLSDTLSDDGRYRPSVTDRLQAWGEITLYGVGSVTIEVVVTPVVATVIAVLVTAVIPLAAGGAQIYGVLHQLRDGDYAQAVKSALGIPFTVTLAAVSPLTLLGAKAGAEMGAHAGHALAQNVWQHADESRALLAGREAEPREPLSLRAGISHSVSREIVLRMASYDGPRGKASRW